MANEVDQRPYGFESPTVDFIITDDEIELLFDGIDDSDYSHRVKLRYRSEQRRGLGKLQSPTIQSQYIINEQQYFLFDFQRGIPFIHVKPSQTLAGTTL